MRTACRVLPDGFSCCGKVILRQQRYWPGQKSETRHKPALSLPSKWKEGSKPVEAEQAWSMGKSEENQDKTVEHVYSLFHQNVPEEHCGGMGLAKRAEWECTAWLIDRLEMPETRTLRASRRLVVLGINQEISLGHQIPARKLAISAFPRSPIIVAIWRPHSRSNEGELLFSPGESDDSRRAVQLN
jgi:hypothetical protein